MKLRYGSKTWDSGLVDPRISRTFVFNAANLPEKIRQTWDLVGFISESSQAAITAEIQEIEAAFAQNGQNLDMLFDDGSVSAHLIVNAATIGGVRVLSGPNWDPGPGQYANWRSWTAQLQADFQGPGFLQGGGLSFFQETIELFGGGPQDELALSLEGPPISERIYAAIPYGAIQSGRIVGMLAPPPVPMPIFPANLKRRLETPYTSETSPGPTGSSGAFRYEGFERSYRYEFESPTPLFASPSLWHVI